MDIFFTLLGNLIPLYFLIGLGFIAARFFEVERNTLANLAVFIFLPIVVFGFVLNLEFQTSFIALPIIVWCVQTIIGLTFLKIAQKIYDGAEANILAMSCSMGNAGYFGLPLALLLFTPEQVGIYIFAMIGGSVYEATVGYYIAARGRFDAKTSLKKLLKFPTLYAMGLAFFVRWLGVEPSAQFDLYWGYFKGAYIVIGMMIVGAALARVTSFVIGPRFLALTILGKFITYPALVFGFTLVDRHLLGWFEPGIYSILMVLSIVPTAANVAAFASQLDLVPEKAATTVLIGTVIALFYIPAMLILMGMH
jgi:predicted permease